MVVGATVRGCEVAVIGSGPGGYVAAIRLAQLKKDTLLIEASPSLGGVCLNEGCIPSKALIHAANLVDEMGHAADMGIRVGTPTVDMPALIQWKGKIVKRLTDGVRFLVTKNGAQVMTGRARFETDRRLAVDTAEGTQYVEFQQAIIATGTTAARLPGFEPDGDRVIGSREALALSEIPPRLVVIGGGYIGLELGTVFRKLGAHVEVVEYLPELLPGADKAVRDTFQRALKKRGIKLHLGCRAVSVERGSPCRLTVEKREGGTRFEIETDRVLVSVGRRPNTADLNLKAIGVTTDDRGYMAVNDRLQTSVPGIYAIGDVVGGPQLAHKASREAKVAAEVIAGRPAVYDPAVVPAVVYTDPEIATVGLTEDEARAKGIDVLTGTFSLKASGRAMTLNATDGFVKVVAERESKRVIGLHCVGPNASELIAEGALAIEMGAFLDDIAGVIHPHPTLSEGVLDAVELALGECVNAMNP